MAQRLSNFTSGPIDKAPKSGPKISTKELAIQKQEPLRDRPYLDSFAHRFCWVCGAPAVAGCHLNANHAGGKGIKGPDNEAIPLCHGHHSEMDNSGNVSLWLMEHLIKPMARDMYDRAKHYLPPDREREPRRAMFIAAVSNLNEG